MFRALSLLVPRRPTHCHVSTVRFARDHRSTNEINSSNILTYLSSPFVDRVHAAGDILLIVALNWIHASRTIVLAHITSIEMRIYATYSCLIRFKITWLLRNSLSNKPASRQVSSSLWFVTLRFAQRENSLNLVELFL